MTIVLHERHNILPNKSFCYNPSLDLLQVEEEILRQLQAERNQDIPSFKFYYDEMEKIHSGLTGIQEASIKLDEFFGSLGLPNTNKKLEKGAKYGLC